MVRSGRNPSAQGTSEVGRVPQPSDASGRRFTALPTEIPTLCASPRIVIAGLTTTSALRWTRFFALIPWLPSVPQRSPLRRPYRAPGRRTGRCRGRVASGSAAIVPRGDSIKFSRTPYPSIPEPAIQRTGGTPSSHDAIAPCPRGGPTLPRPVKPSRRRLGGLPAVHARCAFRARPPLSR
jgi:hypothetical protein